MAACESLTPTFHSMLPRTGHVIMIRDSDRARPELALLNCDRCHFSWTYHKLFDRFENILVSR